MRCELAAPERSAHTHTKSPLPPRSSQAWVWALVSAVGTLLLEGALLVLRLSRADALEARARRGQEGRPAAPAPLDPLGEELLGALGGRGGAAEGEALGDRAKDKDA